MSGLSLALRRPREYRPQPDNPYAGFLSHCYRNPDMTDQPEAEPGGFPTPTSGRFSVVVIAASAGGLAAITAVLAPLPPDFPAAVAIVRHRSPDGSNTFEELLGKRTALAVKPADEGDLIRAGIVYVAPPGFHLIVNESGRLSLSHSAKVRFSRPAADRLFLSAAEHVKTQLIAVVLTGGARDGTDGIMAVKRAGGTVIAQDKATSEHFSMPKSAIATGDVDFILPITEIGPALITLVRQEQERQS
jgi:two-component system chemotaxis response regulator CheB